MKRSNLIICFLSALFLSSCGEDFITTEPTAALPTETAITTVSDAQYAVNGIYNTMQTASYCGATIQYYGDVKGDDMQCWWQQSRDNYYCYTFNHLSSGLRAGNLWGQPLFVIRLASHVIEAIDNKVQDGNEAERNDLKGQAIALRAMAHFDMLRCFAYPYAKDNGASWGVPIIDHALSMDEHPIRSTVAESYNFIIKQLNIAIPLLSDEKNNGKMNVYAARALLSRVYLYACQDKNAYETASQLIEDLKANNKYSLYSSSEYVKAWSLNSKFGKESLFEIAYTATDNNARDGLSYLLHWWGYADIVATRTFRNLTRSDRNDVRDKLIVERFHSGRNIYTYTVNKYPGTADNTPSYYNNYPLIRLSEVYLIAAEAGVKLGGSYLEPAREYLNAIVKRGNPANSVSVANFTLTRVLTERRKELIGEGHRYFDILRNGLKVDRQLDLQYGYHLPNVPTDIDWNFEKCILPIPINQFKFNKEMQQNPGYTRE